MSETSQRVIGYLPVCVCDSECDIASMGRDVCVCVCERDLLECEWVSVSVCPCVGEKQCACDRTCDSFSVSVCATV